MRNKRFKRIKSAMLLGLAFCMTLGVRSTFAQTKTNVSEFGRETLVQSIGFGNNVWNGYSETDHTEESYKEIAELGFNSVRFYMSCTWFEGAYNFEDYVDANGDSTYPYKESGWEILDQNITWAKKYGIKLILNMHVPQGGFQSNGKGMTLWFDKKPNGTYTYPKGGDLTNNQKRLNALWKEIAKRYKDEDTIIGYDLANEVYVPCLDADGNVATSLSQVDKEGWSNTLAQWPKLASKITESIRATGDNHTVIVENTFKTRIANMSAGKINVFTSADVKNTSSTWELFEATRNVMQDVDDNYAVELHLYYPFTLSYMYNNPSYANAKFTDKDKKFVKDDLLGALAKWRDGFTNSKGQYIEGTNIPIFLGEFGYCDEAYNKSNAAEATEFVIQTCKEYGINYSYHQYHGNGFGLYPYDEKQDVVLESRNKILADVLGNEQASSNITLAQEGNTIEGTIQLNGVASEFNTKLEYDSSKFKLDSCVGLNGWTVSVTENGISAISEGDSAKGTDIIKFVLKPIKHYKDITTTVKLVNAYADNVCSVERLSSITGTFKADDEDNDQGEDNDNQGNDETELPPTGTLPPWMVGPNWEVSSYNWLVDKAPSLGDALTPSSK